MSNPIRFPLYFLAMSQCGTGFRAFIDKPTYDKLKGHIEAGMPVVVSVTSQHGVDAFIANPVVGGLSISVSAAVASDGTTVYHPVYTSPADATVVSPEPFDGCAQANPANYPFLIATVRAPGFASRIAAVMESESLAEPANSAVAPKPEDIPG